jgi:hypothetical protein
MQHFFIFSTDLKIKFVILKCHPDFKDKCEELYGIIIVHAKIIEVIT